MRIWLLAMVILSLLLYRTLSRFHPNELTVLFFDVGQGDSTLVTFPDGQNLLVDGGGGWGEKNIGERELFLELARLSILTLDAVALSHPDQDHGFGLLGVFQNLSVKEFWYNRFDPPKPLLSQLLRKASTQASRIRPVSTVATVTIGEVKLIQIPLHRSGNKSNNRALVLILEYGNCRVFLGGDIEKAGEQEVLPWLNNPISVLKVSHHGSRTSTTPIFLDRARPKAAVISAGRQNTYGHPHNLILKRLKWRAIETFRTDFHGFVRFKFTQDGRMLCTSARGECGQAACQVKEPSFSPGSN